MGLLRDCTTSPINRLQHYRGHLARDNGGVGQRLETLSTINKLIGANYSH